MARNLSFRELTGEELIELQRILRSRSTPAGLQRRVKRFLESGIAGLSDRPKSERPREYDEDSTTEIIKVASARPKDLGLKFTTWSLQKLEEYLKKRPGLKKVTRSTIRRRLQTEGFKFKAGQTWCESNDPDFEVKKTKS